MKISQKMILGSTLLVAIPLLIASISSTIGSSMESEKAITQQIENRLVAIREMQKSHIQDYFDSIKNQIITLSSQSLTTEAMRAFKVGFDNYAEQSANLSYDDAKNGIEHYYNGAFSSTYKKVNEDTSVETRRMIELLDQTSTELQYAYIANNRYPLGEKNKLQAANDQTLYSQAHSQFHREFNDFLETFGYYDIFLVDMQGNVVYSVFKEVDFATNLINGPYANSGLAEAFEASKVASGTDHFDFVDFAPYLPSYNAPASFISSPIFDDGQQIGTLIFQMPIDNINKIMTMEGNWKAAGLGVSGEVYLVGDDYKARSLSRFLMEDEKGFFGALKQAGIDNTAITAIQGKGTNIGIQVIQTHAVDQALSGKSGIEVIRDYRDVEVLAAYAPITILGNQWAILSEIDEEEAFAAINTLENRLMRDALIAFILLLSLGAWAGLLFSRAITNPISRLTTSIDLIESNSDLTARLSISSQDELGAMANSLNRMLEKFQQSMSKVSRTTERLATTSEELTAVTRETTDAVNRQRSETDSVAAAMNEMNATVQEVSNNASNAANSASEANQQTLHGKQIVNDSIAAIERLAEEISKASEVINHLEKDSEAIGSVLDVIRGIAEQTNLLALNAAIEAARAGEQGRGFAVVADEVRTLASRTQESTQEIQVMIERLQDGSRRAVAAMEEGANQASVSVEYASKAGDALETITQAVGQISEMNTLIATAAEEQSAVAEEINANVSNISHVADDTATGANQVTSESEKLAQVAVELQTMVNQFKI